MPSPDAPRYIAEFLATFVLVGAALLSGGSPLVAGVTLAAVTALTLHVSGGHVNPAMTLAAAARDPAAFPPAVSAGYVVAQVAGALVAAAAAGALWRSRTVEAAP